MERFVVVFVISWSFHWCRPPFVRSVCLMISSSHIIHYFNIKKTLSLCIIYSRWRQKKLIIPRYHRSPDRPPCLEGIEFFLSLICFWLKQSAPFICSVSCFHFVWRHQHGKASPWRCPRHIFQAANHFPNANLVCVSILACLRQRPSVPYNVPGHTK